MNTVLILLDEDANLDKNLINWAIKIRDHLYSKSKTMGKITHRKFSNKEK